MLLLATAGLGFTTEASAQSGGVALPAAPDGAVVAAKPPPYSRPFQLRPVMAASVLRSDTAFAFYENPVSGETGSTVASTLLFSY
ncbi:MAG TPA: hypothetical protein VER33_04805, partial [Polyangiaceae bacterium]|nr:hypothetical protein [Polyangiaceae bacterium]